MTPPPLTITPARAARESPGDQRDRRGEDQRARRGDDQHRDGADRIAADQPGPQRHGERQRQEEQRVAVGEAHERRPLGLGLLARARTIAA